MSTPQISIGLPVRNGERFLAAALNSILAQTRTDFEVIVSDNASTDDTPQICDHFASRDGRIRVQRQPHDVGAARNFNAVLAAARAPYFKWAADDDLLAPTFLECCAGVLDHDPGVVLCHPRVRVIDETGAPLDDYGLQLTGATSPRASERLGDLVGYDHCCYEIFGVIRRDVLARTPAIAPYPGSDRVLLAELALHGRFHEVDDFLLLSRDHPSRSIRSMRALHLRAGWFAPELAGRRMLPHWRLLAEYIRAIRRAPLSRRERMACYRALGRWFRLRRNRRWLLGDLVIAAHPGAWERFDRLRRRIGREPPGIPRSP